MWLVDHAAKVSELVGNHASGIQLNLAGALLPLNPALGRERPATRRLRHGPTICPLPYEMRVISRLSSFRRGTEIHS
jgi:hypothetical protein